LKWRVPNVNCGSSKIRCYERQILTIWQIENAFSQVKWK
jgi:hypothetical protein